MRKLLTADLGKVKTFLERERKDLERFQRQIPGEVKKLRDFVKGQRRELEKLLKNVRSATIRGQEGQVDGEPAKAANPEARARLT